MFLLNILCHITANCSSAISIHPMFLLNRTLCRSLQQKTYFNTSHVSIKRIWQSLITKSLQNFNTSHVSIKPIMEELEQPSLKDFNTSHVSIKQSAHSGGTSYFGISIHPMFLLNKAEHTDYNCLFLISIHPMFLLNYSCLPFFVWIV